MKRWLDLSDPWVLDLSDLLILGGVLMALLAVGVLFGPAVSVLVASMLTVGFGFAVHRARRRF